MPSVQHTGLVLVWLSGCLVRTTYTRHIAHIGGRCSGNALRLHFAKSWARISPRTHGILLEVFLVCGFCHVRKMRAAMKVVPVRAMNLNRMSQGLSPLRRCTNPGDVFFTKFCMSVALQYGMRVFYAPVAY